MRLIRGHKSYDMGELIEILRRQGNFTCPALPHYRYGNGKGICRTLLRLRLIARSGVTPEAINYVVTDRFRAWVRAHEAGETALGAVKWSKTQNRVEISKP